MARFFFAAPMGGVKSAKLVQIAAFGPEVMFHRPLYPPVGNVSRTFMAKRAQGCGSSQLGVGYSQLFKTIVQAPLCSKKPLSS
jgi:hypothetical protein